MGVYLAQLLKGLYAVHLRHPDVQHYYMKMLVPDLLERLGGPLRRFHGERRGQRVGDRLARAVFIVHNKHPRGFGGPLMAGGRIGDHQAEIVPFRHGWNMMCVCRRSAALSNLLA